MTFLFLAVSIAATLYIGNAMIDAAMDDEDEDAEPVRPVRRRRR